MSGEFESPKLDYSGDKKQKKKIRLPKFVRLADENDDANVAETEIDANVTEARTEVEEASNEIKTETEAEAAAANAIKADVEAEKEPAKETGEEIETEEAATVIKEETAAEKERAEDKEAENETEETTIDEIEAEIEEAADEIIAETEGEEAAAAIEKETEADKEIDASNKGEKKAEVKDPRKESEDSEETLESFDDSEIVIEDLDDDPDFDIPYPRQKGKQRKERRNNDKRIPDRQTNSYKPKVSQLKKKAETRIADKKSARYEKRKSKPEGIPIIIKVLLAILILLFTAYIASVIYFMSHFSWAISAEGGEQLFNMTAEDVRSVLQNQVQDYFVAVEARDLDTIYLSGHDIDMTCSFDGDIKDAIKSQNPWLWFTYKNNPTTIDLPVQIHLNDEKLNSLLDEAIYSKSGRKPTNARFVDDPSQSAFLVQPEDNGTVIDRDKATAIVSETIKGLGDAVNLDAEGVYTNAEVTVADLEKNGFYKNLIDLCKTRVDVDWHGIPVVIDKEFIYPLIQNDGQKAWIDYEPVYDYVKKLSRQYDLFGQPHKFTDTEGHEINVVMGAYGWLVDREATAKGIYELICKGGSSAYEPVYRYEAYARGESDIGDSYAEINLTRQHMYLYVDGKVVVESDFVSGNPMKGNGTHVGIYGVTYKERDATLKGQGYSSSVSYWMPFNGNEGMHDATWRSVFGGRIYKGGGSHGCINLPKDIASQIFEYVETGFPVIVFVDPEDPAFQEGDDKTSEPATSEPTEEKKENKTESNEPLFDTNSGLYYIVDPATNTPIFLDPETMQPTDVATAVSKLKALQEEGNPSP